MICDDNSDRCTSVTPATPAVVRSVSCITSTSFPITSLMESTKRFGIEMSSPTQKKAIEYKFKSYFDASFVGLESGQSHKCQCITPMGFLAFMDVSVGVTLTKKLWTAITSAQRLGGPVGC